jgi:hypothetical protein
VARFSPRSGYGVSCIMRASLGTSSRHARVKVEVLRERDQVLTQVSLRLSPAGACGMSSHTPSGRTGIAVGCTPVYLTGSGIAVEPDAAGVDEFFLNPRPLVEDRKRFDRASEISLLLPWREGKRGGGFARSVSPPTSPPPVKKGGGFVVLMRRRPLGGGLLMPPALRVEHHCEPIPTLRGRRGGALWLC